MLQLRLFRVEGLKVWGLGFRIHTLLRVSGFEFRVLGVRFRIHTLVWVQGLGFCDLRFSIHTGW